MRRKKVLIGLAVAAVLSVTVAGAAHAATDGSARGYQGGTAAVPAATQTQAETLAQDGGGSMVAGQAGNGNENGTCLQRGDGTCGGTCDGACGQSTTQSQNYERQRSGNRRN